MGSKRSSPGTGGEGDGGRRPRSPARAVAEETTPQPPTERHRRPRPPAERSGDFAHYRLIERIGRGGMGDVYRARDTRLERQVAVKFLSSRLVGDEQAQARFLHEARAASAIDHPNICTIYEIEHTEDGELYLVMAHYEGQTLAERIHLGPLPVDEALDLARQMLTGLARAHEAGIVHRDVKPGNLMITPYGELKILDFGLARLAGHLDPSGDSHVQGTAAYMAPEQVRGGGADHRSDVWSAGVVLYEMLAGEPPFRGEHAPGILYRVLHDDPEPLSAYRDDLPPGLEQAVATALTREPERRYQTVRELLADLEGPPPSFSAPPTLAFPRPGRSAPSRSILVLPFANVSPDRDLDYFSDGLTDELITDLSSIDSLRVISRTSAMQLKGSTKDIRTIGRELAVQYVLEGAVRIRGDSLRLTAKLVDAGRDVNLWADKFTGRLDDVLEIQEELSRQIVGALKIRLSPSEEERLAERPIGDARAFECYLRAKQETLAYTEEALDRAIVFLDEAERIVGENVLLLSARAYAFWQYVNAGISTDRSLLEDARARAERILELDPDSAHGHRLLALLAISDGEPQEAVLQGKLALAKDPNDSDTLAALLACYAYVGRPVAATPIAEKLVRIDPLTPLYQAISGAVWLMAGDLDRAMPVLERAYRLEPDNPMIGIFYGQALVFAGRRDEGLALFDTLAESAGDTLFGRIARGLAAGLRGDRETVASCLDPASAAAARSDPEYAWMVAEGWAALGDARRAVEWMEAAFDRGFLNHPLLAEHDPFFEAVRPDPGFQALLARMQERWKAFEA